LQVGSTTFPRVSSGPSRFWSPRHQLGPIVGGVVAALAIILIFVYLLLRHRASQREIRLRAAEIDPTPTPLNFVNTREGPGRHVSIGVNDDGSRSEMPRPTGTLCFVVLAVPVILTTRFLQFTPLK
jgi:hypothetical protein